MPLQTDHRTAAAATIMEVMRCALTAYDVPSAVLPALHALVERTHAEGAAYVQLSDAGEFVTRGVVGAPGLAGQAIPQGSPLLRALRAAQAPLFYDNTWMDPDTADFPAHGVGALAIAPVLDAEARLVGAFVMYVHSAHSWHEDDAELFAALAGAIGLLAVRLITEESLRKAHEAALRALGLMLEARDTETGGHTDRVTVLAVALGGALGLQAAQLQHLRWGAYLHDIGKVAVPDHVLLKPGKLEAHEWLTMQSHVLAGERFARALNFLPEPSLAVIGSHHERWDGRGYPRGLAGEAIPQEARIFAVCDVYDALVSDRPYHKPWAHEETLAEIERSAGSHFDPAIAQVFCELMRREDAPHPVAAAACARTG
ncbi:HD domain-containing phosphohydrolase [Deinococcus hopiensis]|uniref:Metal dependent phosphohydrolase n=1 Tax=Deinococcus hopiensis KR-140 TaxID=695939 RepID=A0A1W1UBS3_9DEIO|nr:HD domain-containing phosphohydrolase [Deinococcus hopiensis]SMB78546.1 metal dependent phosphohydrolase [Deinococcus hopiensis KR-140]